MGRALIVSAGANSNEYLCARLTELGYTRPLIVPSGAEARRRMLESDFELIVVNAVSYTHLRAHETPEHLVSTIIHEKKK